jgi:DNA polymerase III subunit delta
MSTLKSIYLFSGDEPLLLAEAADHVFAQATSGGTSHKTRLDEATFTVEHIQSLTSNLSLFETDDYLLYENAKLGEKFGKTIKALFENGNSLGDTTTLVITCPRLTPAHMKTAWHKVIEAHGMSQRIWPITLDKMPSWINQKARGLGLQLDVDAANLLATRSENNLLAAKQVLDKLALSETGHVGLETLEGHLIDQAKFDVFMLCDVMLAGDAPKALRMLDLLLGEKTEPTIIVWALVKDIRLLATLHDAKTKSSLPALFKQHRIWPNRQPLIQKSLTRLSQKDCLHALQSASHLDQLTKGMAVGDVRFGLQQFLVTLTQPKALTPAA